MGDLAKWKVHGPVRTLKTEFAEWDLNQGEWGPPRSVTLCTFRPDGNISESDHHNRDGSIAHSRYLYSEAGRLVETQFWIDNGPPQKSLYSYDNAGRHVRTAQVNQDGTQRESEACSYDSGGRKTKVCFLLPPSNPGMPVGYPVEGTNGGYSAPGATTMTVAYDECAQPIETLFHDANRHLILRVALARDEAGRLLSEEAYGDIEILIPQLRQARQAAPQEILAGITAMFTKLLDPNGAFSSTAYRYDQDGRLLVRNKRMGALSEESTSFRYDERGNPIEEITEDNSRDVGVDEQGEPQTASENSSKQRARFDYKYDARGNWTERVVESLYGPNSDFQRSNVERREISYYKV